MVNQPAEAGRISDYIVIVPDTITPTEVVHNIDNSITIDGMNVFSYRFIV